MSDQLPENGQRRTPLERIKAQHQQKREQLLYGDVDELDWDDDISPTQVGLVQVWVDEEGKAWMFVRRDGQLKLKRIWTQL